MKDNHVIEVHNTDTSPAEMIKAAVMGGADLDKLEKLLELQERYEANQARKLFAKAFSIAQANIIPVIKKRFNSQTKSKYSELSDVIEVSQPIYTKEGFSITFNEGDSPLPEHVRILAVVLHCAGHKENYHFNVPLDGKGMQGNANMTKIHGKASSVSYGRRYLICMIWNIPTQDNDGNKPVSKITQKQLSILLDLLNFKEMSEKKLIDFLKVDSMEDLPESRYMEAMQAINAFVKVAK